MNIREPLMVLEKPSGDYRRSSVTDPRVALTSQKSLRKFQVILCEGRTLGCWLYMIYVRVRSY